jgi:hypothetical protein
LLRHSRHVVELAEQVSRADLNATRQHLTVLLCDVDAMSQRLDELEHMLGRESNARDQA